MYGRVGDVTRISPRLRVMVGRYLPVSRSARSLSDSLRTLAHARQRSYFPHTYLGSLVLALVFLQSEIDFCLH